ncbi:MAG TPA: TonB family protein [Gammaproteobacteria bacterium]|nr:TonB family protein [Gammaproteobacteria bacterium]
MGTSVSGDNPASSKQNDALLWLMAALIAGVGITWLLISSPWSSHSTEPPAPSARTAETAGAAPSAGTAGAPSAQTAGTTPSAGTDGTAPSAATAGAAPSAETADTAAPQHGEARTEIETPLDDNPLRMADLAYEAGMLVEPEEYSAWTLYRHVFENDPGNAEAKQGLEKIADELLRRAGAAIEQGRFDDARKTVNRIREALPEQAGAKELAARLDELTPKKVAAASAPAEQKASAETAAEREAKQKKAEAAAKPAAPKVDPVVEAHDAFAAAMTGNKLLTPIDSSAKHFVNVLTAIAPDAPLTKAAQRQLFDKLLARAEESLAGADTDAATTWIDEADGLAVDADAVAKERKKLTDQLVKIESARRLPASEFKVVSYTPPVYPQRALEREISGWVDLEFTVTRDGTTRDIVVTGASNDRYFKQEAIDAVAKWRFEPRVFMNQTIEQRAYSRIRFDIEG